MQIQHRAFCVEASKKIIIIFTEMRNYSFQGAETVLDRIRFSDKMILFIKCVDSVKQFRLIQELNH